MKCSNCGKEIPFSGRVCPYCRADKSGDQVLHAMAIGGGIIGAIVAFVVLNLDLVPGLGVAFGGAIVFAIVGAKLAK